MTTPLSCPALEESNPPTGSCVHMSACPHIAEGGTVQRIADAAANDAVKKVFFMLGVDVNDAAAVEEYRENIRFSKVLRGYAAHGMLALIGMLAAMLVAAFVAGLKAKL